MTIEIETYELPEHWASALINGDEDGYSDSELQAIDRFNYDMIERYGQSWCMGVDIHDGGDFRRYHDATRYGVLACDVAIFTFDVTPRATAA